MLSASSFRELLDAPLTELMPAAAARRDARTGRRITFSPKVFVPLTMLCRDRCGYCTFAKPPARLETPYLAADQVLELASPAAARAGVPSRPGILVGVGETRAGRVEALIAIANAHLEHGHVQEVIVQNFLPKAGTAMHRAEPCPTDEFLWSIAAARLILPDDIHLQAPPNLSDDVTPLLAAGIDDWGGVSPLTIDHVNPERPWPALDRLRETTEAAGFVLALCLTVYPEYVQRAEEWLHPDVRTAVLVVSDLEGLARDTAWAPG